MEESTLDKLYKIWDRSEQAFFLQEFCGKERDFYGGEQLRKRFGLPKEWELALKPSDPGFLEVQERRVSQFRRAIARTKNMEYGIYFEQHTLPTLSVSEIAELICFFLPHGVWTQQRLKDTDLWMGVGYWWMPKIDAYFRARGEEWLKRIDLQHSIGNIATVLKKYVLSHWEVFVEECSNRAPEGEEGKRTHTLQ